MQKSILPAVAFCSALLLGLLTFSCSKGGAPGEFLKAPPTHGTSFLLAFEPGSAGAQSNLVASLAEVERHRFAKLGVRIYWEAPATNTIRIVAAIGANQLERARNLVSRPGWLELRLVHPESDELIAQGQGDPGYEVMPSNHMSKSGKEVPGFLVKTKPEMTSEHIAFASVSHDRNGKAGVRISLDDAGTGQFASITGSNLGRQLAIVLDGSVVSAPVINSQITSGDVDILGQLTETEALGWAYILDSPLPVPVKIVETKSF